MSSFTCTAIFLQLTLCLASPTSSGDHDVVNMLKNTVTTLQDDVKTHIADIAALKVQVAELKEGKEKSDAEISKLNDQLHKLDLAYLQHTCNHSSETKTQVRSVAAKVASMENDLKVINARLQEIETNSSQNYYFFNSTMSIMSDLTEKQLNSVHKLQALQQALNSVEAVAVGNRESLRKMKEDNTRRDNSSEESLRLTAKNELILMEMAMKVRQLNDSLGCHKPDATFQVTGGTITHNGPLAFTRVLLDPANRFNLTSGTYVAPYSGKYLVWAQIDKTVGNIMYLYIEKSGVQIAASYTPVRGDVTVTAIAVAEVKADEVLYVTMAGADRISGNKLWSTFGGTLL